MKSRVLILGCVALAATSLATPASAVDRPPQFVVMAFDNCTELDRWKELIDFAGEMNAAGDKLHFTFFVSGANFLSNDHRNLYQGPHHQRGYSNIYFGGTPEDVRRRVGYVNMAYKAGHEIASHAVGHFDGRGWSAANWTAEFESYKQIFENVARNNALPDDVKFDFPFTAMVGFRAPYLSTSAGLYRTLTAGGFRYDTSADSDPAAWPEKKDGLWRFNLARIRIHGSRMANLSMDYNFLVAQSRGRPDPRRADWYREQMLQSYLDYFRANYTGNRAPLNIGHHFFGYQGGVYNQALKTFARIVCGLLEVRCTTYVKLADFMDGLSPETLAAYQHGDFPHADAPAFVFKAAAVAPH